VPICTLLSGGIDSSLQIKMVQGDNTTIGQAQMAIVAG
jgi:asparagine synthetase B (glutamine-hydrolysing)